MWRPHLSLLLAPCCQTHTKEPGSAGELLLLTGTAAKVLVVGNLADCDFAFLFTGKIQPFFGSPISLYIWTSFWGARSSFLGADWGVDALLPLPEKTPGTRFNYLSLFWPLYPLQHLSLWEIEETYINGLVCSGQVCFFNLSLCLVLPF